MKALSKKPDDLTAAYMAGFERGKDSVKAELAEAKKCPWCGSNDLVCGKGWKDERDKLKADIKALTDKLQRYETALKDIATHGDAMLDASGCYQRVKIIARNALTKED